MQTKVENIKSNKENKKGRPVSVGSVLIGGPDFTVIAGPCSIESESQFFETANYVKDKGASILRGGIWKLRTQPLAFQGLGESSFEFIKKVKKEVGLQLCSEVTDPRQIEWIDDVIDIFQVGSRNMHNYELLKELGKTKKPILLKRGFAALVDEWIKAADYLVHGGNDNVILCERGIRTFENVTRNTLDLNAVVYIKEKTNYPVLVDPSHAVGIRSLVTPLAYAAAAAGADGIIVEVHPRPQEALSDGMQALTLDDFDKLMSQMNKLLSVFDKKLAVYK
jgi:3-deoxy-7-phosphoheptulonate synthase